MAEIDPDELVRYHNFSVPMKYYERALERCIMKGSCYIWSGASCGGRWPQMGVRARMNNGEIKSRVISVSKMIWAADKGYFPKRLKRTCGEDLCVNPDHFKEETAKETDDEH